MLGGLLSAGGELDTGGCDEPFDGVGCVPDVPAGLATLPGADVAGCGDLGFDCVAPETPPAGLGFVPIVDPGAPVLLPIALPLTTNSTLRFCCRPAAVALVATGFDSPNPLVVTASVPTP